VRTLVLGLGNDIAGDDAVGPLVARALLVELEDVADVVESSSSGLALIEVFAGYDRAIVVDSILTGRSPAGTITEMGLLDVGHVVASSLHNAGLPELAAVAARLGLGFPSQTVVFAIEVEDPYTFGAGLSPPVKGAVEELVQRVRAQVRTWEGEAACTTTMLPRSSSNA
jgi:hydrogenase maturation protease